MSHKLMHLAKKSDVQQALEQDTKVTTLCGYTDSAENIDARYSLGESGTKPACVLCAFMLYRLMKTSRN